MYKSRSGIGQYAEISQIRHNENPDNYFDVFNDNFTDWANPYDVQRNNDHLNLDCIKSQMQKMVNGKLPTTSEIVPSEIIKEEFRPEEFWYNDPLELIRKDRIFNFIPQTGMSQNEYLNSLTRLGIYVSIILALLYNNHKYLYIIVLVLLFTIFLHNKQRMERMSTSYNCPQGYQYGSVHNNPPKCGEEPTMIYSESKAYPNSVKKKGLTKTYYTDRGDITVPVNNDQVCSLRYNNPTTGGYNWIKQSDHADFRGNSRLVNNTTPNNIMSKLTGDISDSYGKELASRNSYISVHKRDIVNTDMPRFLYGDNLDRRMYYGRR